MVDGGSSISFKECFLMVVNLNKEHERMTNKSFEAVMVAGIFSEQYTADNRALFLAF